MLDRREEKQRSTPTVVPGAALPWQVLGRVGGFDVYCAETHRSNFHMSDSLVKSLLYLTDAIAFKI